MRDDNVTNIADAKHHYIDIEFTEDQLDYLEEKAHQAGVTFHDYVVSMLTGIPRQSTNDNFRLLSLSEEEKEYEATIRMMAAKQNMSARKYKDDKIERFQNAKTKDEFLNECTKILYEVLEPETVEMLNMIASKTGHSSGFDLVKDDLSKDNDNQSLLVDELKKLLGM